MENMRTGLYLLLLGCSLILQPASAGDELVIPGMDEVLGEFGEPDERFGPVGEPPITEWVYGSFRVYFEHHIVLHTIDLNTLIMPK
jgi:hypothetical protein